MAGGKSNNRRLIDEETNPCLKEHSLVNKCLTKEDYDYGKCEIFFENYRQCKRFWNKIQSQRKAQDIVPHLPCKEERDKIWLEMQGKVNNLKT